MLDVGQNSFMWQLHITHAVWRSAVCFFSRFTNQMKHNLLGIDACFECQNDAVSKILQVTDTPTDKYFDYYIYNPLRMRTEG